MKHNSNQISKIRKMYLFIMPLKHLNLFVGKENENYAVSDMEECILRNTVSIINLEVNCYCSLQMLFYGICTQSRAMH